MSNPLDQSLVAVHNLADDYLSDTDSTLYLLRKGRLLSTYGAVFNFVGICVGTGVLALPSAIGHVGWIGGVVLLLLAVISNSTAKMLIACMHLSPDDKVHKYEDIGRVCLGNFGFIIVGLAQSITLFGVCTIFLILIGGNVHSLVPSVGQHVWVFIAGCCLIPVSWLKTMSEVQFLSYFGVTSSFLVALGVIVVGFIDGNKDKVADRTYDVFTDLSGLSIAFNIIIFSFGFHSVLPHIEMVMKKREDFPKVSNIAVSFIAAVYFLVAMAGYYGYGSAIEDNVLKNMGDSPIVKVCHVLISIHVFVAYPLPLNPLCINIESALKINRLEGNQELLFRIILRTSLVVSTMLIASVVPYFGNFLSLVSALSIVFTAFVFPPVFYYILMRRQRQPISTAYTVYMLLIVLVGCCASGVGLYYSINQLLQAIKDNPNPFAHFWTT